MVNDWHTHHLRRNAVVDIDPADYHEAHDRKGPAGGRIELRKGYLYSAGVHPWNAEKATMKDLLTVRALAAEPNVVAIGETGLDTIDKAGTLERQIEILKYHVNISEEAEKPLILHIVKRFPEIIQLKRLLKPKQRWIIHGFRGKPELAKELLRHGFYLSFGEKFNPESVAATPKERRLTETDESTMPIGKIKKRIGEHLTGNCGE